MVGNISDRHALAATRQYIPFMSVKRMLPMTVPIPNTPAMVSMRDGLNQFMSHVDKKRKTAKSTIAAMLYFWASSIACCSSIPCDVNSRMPYCMMYDQQATCAPM